MVCARIQAVFFKENGIKNGMGFKLVPLGNIKIVPDFYTILTTVITER